MPLSRTLLALVLLTSGVSSIVAEPGEVAVVHPEFVEPDGRFRWLPEPRPRSQPRFGLALGGGAAWGIAHLGFLEAMREEGLRPDLVAGTSIGAIIGAGLASGYSAAEVEGLLRLEESRGARSPVGARPTERAFVLDPLSPAAALGRWGRTPDGEKLPARGIFPDRRILDGLASYFARAEALSGGDLDRLALPFRAVTTDLIGGEAYAPRYGSLVTLLRASIGLPVFAPVRLDGRLLVDGGAVEFVPIPTVRSMGADVAVGVRLSSDGNGLTPYEGRGGFRKVAGRYDALVEADQRERLLAEADLIVEAAVGEASIARFQGQIPELVEAGREAFDHSREALFALLEERGGSRRFTLRSIAAERPSETRLALEFAGRSEFSGEPVERSELRIELALSALIVEHDLRDARLSIDTDGRGVLAVEHEPRVTRLEIDATAEIRDRFAHRPEELPASRRKLLGRLLRLVATLHRDGRMLAGITRVDWDPSAGVLRVRLEEGVLDSVELAGRGRDRPKPAELEDLDGRPADVEELAVCLERIEERQSLIAPRIGGAVLEEERGYRLDIANDALPAWEISWNAGLADSLGLTGWFRFRRPVMGRSTSWGSDLVVSAGREGALASVDLGPQGRDGWSPLVTAEIGQPSQQLYRSDGDRGGSNKFGYGRVAGGARFEHAAAGRVELVGEGRYVTDDGLFALGVASTDLGGADFGFGADWRGEFRFGRRERSPALSWALRGSLPVAGEDRASSIRGDVALRLPLDRQGNWSMAAAGRLGAAFGDDPLPLDRQAEAGAWWEAPPLSPGQGRARSLGRASLTFSRRLGLPLGMPAFLSGSFAAWRLDEQRVDPFLDDRGYGGSLFVELQAWRLGSILVGVADGSENGDRFYFVIGAARPRWP